MRRKWKRKTDIGTIFLHWLLVCALFVSVASGLRIASDGLGSTLGEVIGAWLPAHNVWFLHMSAGVGLIALACAYPVYLASTGLSRRILLDRGRLFSLFRPGPARWGALNVLLYWLLFGLLAAQLVSGLLLHRGYASFLLRYHLLFTWLILIYSAGHVLSHFAFGGANQLLRVLRPSPLPVALIDHGEQNASLAALTRRRFQLMALTCLAALAAATGFFYFDRISRDTLLIARIGKSSAPRLNGDLSDPAWRNAKPLVVLTQQGSNLDGSGTSAVEIRALHDEDTAYFAFTWQDPTRSLKQAPLIKTAEGWRVLREESQLAGPLLVKTAFASNLERDKSQWDPSNYEGTFAEDKFSVMLSQTERSFGPGAFHLGAKPLEDRPAAASGRGLHYTTDGSVLEIWLWHAAAALALCDHDQIGEPQEPTFDQVAGLAPYKGGYVSDERKRALRENLRKLSPSDPSRVVPLRLPLDVAQVRAAMGVIAFDPDHSDPEDSIWSMSEAESVAYAPELDERLPVGTIIPGAIARASQATQEDVRCAARWSAGRWTLVSARSLRTLREGDVPIASGSFMWVAVFDHSPSHHTRHIRPIHLELQP
jgi:hypothetical protein